MTNQQRRAAHWANEGHDTIVPGSTTVNTTPRAGTKSLESLIGDPLGWLQLRKWGDAFDDAQRFRIAQGNRLGFDANGKRTKTAPNLPAELFSGQYSLIQSVELAAQKELKRAYKNFVPEPIREFQKETCGLGEHMLARLLGAVGHPAVAIPSFWQPGQPPEGHVCDFRCKPDSKRHLIHGEPYLRTKSQLLQYCGHGAPKRIPKGASQEELLWNGNPNAKKFTFMISESLMKQKANPSKYRLLYEELREEKLHHLTECVRCGPSGKPAQPGSPLSDKHSHMRALRLVGKQFLRDLYDVSLS